MGSDQEKDIQLIGKVGVGFYSAFMMAEKVTLRTRAPSDTPDTSVFLVSPGEAEYTLS